MSMVSGGAYCKLVYCGVKIFSDVGTDLNAGEDMNCVMVPRRGDSLWEGVRRKRMILIE